MSYLIKPYSETRKRQGKEGEDIVKVILQNYLGELLVKTEKENDTLDFETESRWIEIKRRLPPYNSTDKYFTEGALLPFCKFIRAFEEKKPVFFYYYFDADETLWELEFKPEFFELFKPFVLRNHSTNQVHVTVPKSFWKQIDYKNLRKIST